MKTIKELLKKTGTKIALGVIIMLICIFSVCSMNFERKEFYDGPQVYQAGAVGFVISIVVTEAIGKIK